MDENHSKTPQLLKVLSENLCTGEKFIRFEEEFPSGTEDECWIPTIGRNGWILLSADSHLWRRSVLRESLFRHGVRAFIFTENYLRGEARAEVLRKALPEMREVVKDNPPPFVASLTIEGHARIQFDHAFHRKVTRREKTSLRRKRKRKKL